MCVCALKDSLILSHDFSLTLTLQQLTTNLEIKKPTNQPTTTTTTKTLTRETQNSCDQNMPCYSDSDLKIMKLNNTTVVYKRTRYTWSRKAQLGYSPEICKHRLAYIQSRVLTGYFILITVHTFLPIQKSKVKQTTSASEDCYLLDFIIIILKKDFNV